MTSDAVTRHLIVEPGDGSHRLEECRLHGSRFSPVEKAQPDGTFLIAIGLGGHSRWRLGAETLVLAPETLAAFPASPELRATRQGAEEAHFLLWRYRTDTVRAVRIALGQGQPAPTPPRQPAPGPEPTFSGPLLLSPPLRSLVLALRAPPSTPLRTLWYGAKLLELFSLLHQPPSPLAIVPGGGLHPGVQRALALMQASFAEPLSLSDIARAAGLSPTYLSQLFTAEVGHTLTAHLRQLRLEHAAHLLRSGECNVTEAALAVGYASVGQFSHAFRRTFGHPPGVHRPRHASFHRHDSH